MAHGLASKKCKHNAPTAETGVLWTWCIHALCLNRNGAPPSSKNTGGRVPVLRVFKATMIEPPWPLFHANRRMFHFILFVCELLFRWTRNFCEFAGSFVCFMKVFEARLWGLQLFLCVLVVYVQTPKGRRPRLDTPRPDWKTPPSIGWGLSRMWLHRMKGPHSRRCFDQKNGEIDGKDHASYHLLQDDSYFGIKSLN